MSTTINLAQTLGWRVAAHARAAAIRRGFAMQDVLLAATAPELTYSQENYGPGRAMHHRGDLAVAVHSPTRTVITVLLSSAAEWDDADCRQLQQREDKTSGMCR